MSAGLALQEAIAARLGAIAGLTGIYDGPPPRAAYPYLAIDAGTETDWSHKSGGGRELLVALTLWDDQPQRLSALAGLSAENMGRTASWRFLDLGRRLERAVGVCRLLKTFGVDDPSADDLFLLLDLSSSAISYRQRYPGGLAVLAVRDLVALDGSNPRSLAFQVEAIAAHLAALPRLADDGMAEPQQIEATALAANLATFAAAALDGHAVQGIENRLMSLSDAIGRRFFLRGGTPLRASGLTLA